MALLTSDPEFHPTTRRWERRNYPSVPGHLGTVELEISGLTLPSPCDSTREVFVCLRITLCNRRYNEAWRSMS